MSTPSKILAAGEARWSGTTGRGNALSIGRTTIVQVVSHPDCPSHAAVLGRLVVEALNVADDRASRSFVRGSLPAPSVPEDALQVSIRKAIDLTTADWNRLDGQSARWGIQHASVIGGWCARLVRALEGREPEPEPGFGKAADERECALRDLSEHIYRLGLPGDVVLLYDLARFALKVLGELGLNFQSKKVDPYARSRAER